MWPMRPEVKPATVQDLNAVKLAELESKVMGLEKCVMMLAEGIQQLALAHNQNIQTLQAELVKMANYVIRPRTNIMGDQQDKN